MKMNGEIVKELSKNFVVVEIDFYHDGEKGSIQHFAFRKSEVSEEKVAKLYETYNELYDNDQYDATFEDYLKQEGINYDILTFLNL
jgi:hypothetical protein